MNETNKLSTLWLECVISDDIVRRLELANGCGAVILKNNRTPTKVHTILVIFLVPEKMPGNAVMSQGLILLID